MTEFEQGQREYRLFLERMEVQVRAALAETINPIAKSRIEMRLQWLLLEKGVIEEELEHLYI